jgi:hypothetical protein
MRIAGTINTILLIAITVVCFYFGVMGFVSEVLQEMLQSKSTQSVIVDGRTFSSDKKAQAIEEAVILKKYGEWVFDLPELVKLFLTALSFGALGGVTKSTYKLNRKFIKYSDPNVLLNPFFGLLMGLLTLGLSYLIPTVLVSGDTEIRKTSLICFALFAGLFSEHFIKYVERKFVTLIENNNENGNTD